MQKYVVKCQKKLSIILLTLTLCGLISGCNTQSPMQTIETKKSISITVHKSVAGVLKSIASSFLKETGIVVKVIELPDSSEDMYRILNAALCSSEIQFDICMVEDIWLPTFAHRGYIKPLDDFIHINFDEMIEQVANSSVYNGVVYAVPFQIDMGTIFYRKDLMKVEGLSWEQMLEKTGGLTNSNSVSSFEQEGEDMLCNVLELVRYYDGDITSALRLYKAMEKQIGNGADSAVSSFKNGKLALVRSWMTNIGFLNDELSKVRITWAQSMLPNSKNGVPTALTKGYGLAVNTNSENMDEAIQFLKYCMKYKNQVEVIKECHSLPLMREMYHDAVVLDMSPHLKNIEPVLENMKCRRQMVNYTDASQRAKEELQRYLSGEASEQETAVVLEPLALYE